MATWQNEKTPTGRIVEGEHGGCRIHVEAPVSGAWVTWNVTHLKHSAKGRYEVPGDGTLTQCFNKAKTKAAAAAQALDE